MILVVVIIVMQVRSVCDAAVCVCHAVEGGHACDQAPTQTMSSDTPSTVAASDAEAAAAAAAATAVHEAMRDAKYRASLGIGRQR